jgi:hypothetical protein
MNWRMMMKLIKGQNLTPPQKAAVLRAFVYRTTVEHKPATPTGQIPTALSSDAQWIREHAFWIKNDGKLSHNHSHCEPDYMADFSN